MDRLSGYPLALREGIARIKADPHEANGRLINIHLLRGGSEAPIRRCDIKSTGLWIGAIAGPCAIMASITRLVPDQIEEVRFSHAYATSDLIGYAYASAASGSNTYPFLAGLGGAHNLDELSRAASMLTQNLTKLSIPHLLRWEAGNPVFIHGRNNVQFSDLGGGYDRFCCLGIFPNHAVFVTAEVTPEADSARVTRVFTEEFSFTV